MLALITVPRLSRHRITRVLQGCLGWCLWAVVLCGQTPNLPSDSDLLGYWKFDEGGGGTVFDHSGHDRNGTLINGPRWEHGVLHFAGRYDCVEIPTGDDLEFGEDSSYSIVLVLRIHQMPNTGWAGLFTKGRDKGNWLGLWLAPDRNWNFAHGGSNLGVFSPAPDRWSHVICTYDRGVKSFYLDGVQLNSVTDRRGSANYGKIWIGGSGNLSEYANFSIAEARIYNIAVTDAQANALYQELWRSARLGGASREYWLGIAGNTVESFTGGPQMHQVPNGSDIIYSLQCASWDNRKVTQNWADNYAQRIRAWLIPDQSSYYEFVIAADEAAELRLSPDDHAYNAYPICRTAGYTEPMEWYRTPAQLSAPVYLEGGQRYYLEVIHKEGAGNDHLEVGWSRIVNELSGNVQIITGENLVPYSTEAAAEDGAVVAELETQQRTRVEAALRAQMEQAARAKAAVYENAWKAAHQAEITAREQAAKNSVTVTEETPSIQTGNKKDSVKEEAAGNKEEAGKEENFSPQLPAEELYGPATPGIPRISAQKDE